MLIGKTGLFTREGPLPVDVAVLADKLQADGRSIMVVKAGARFFGVLGMMDTPREDALEVITELGRLGIERTIWQNLWASLGVVAFLVPATIFGFAGIGAAVALHGGSTLLVVVNALRLLAYQDSRQRNG